MSQGGRVNRPAASDIFILASNIVRQGTGEHREDLGYGEINPRPLRAHVDIETKPDTVCRYFSRAVRIVYSVLAQTYNPDVLQTHRLVQTYAGYSIDLPNYNVAPERRLTRFVPHTFLTMVSYDANQGVLATPVDPYHVGRDIIPNSSEGIHRLDFSGERNLDSLLSTELVLLTGHSSPSGLTRDTIWPVFEASVRAANASTDLTRLNTAIFACDAIEISGIKNDLASRRQHIARIESSITSQDPNPTIYVYSEDEGKFHLATPEEVHKYVTDQLEKARQGLDAAQEAVAPIQAQLDAVGAYVSNILTANVQRGSNLSPYELMTLNELVDNALASGIQIDEATLALAQTQLEGLSNDHRWIERLTTSEEPEAKYTRQRMEIEGFRFPSEETTGFNTWANLKASYFVLAARCGVTEWVNRLPTRTKISRTTEYDTLIVSITQHLREAGFGSTADQLEQHVNS